MAILPKVSDTRRRIYRNDLERQGVDQVQRFKDLSMNEQDAEIIAWFKANNYPDETYFQPPQDEQQ